MSNSHNESYHYKIGLVGPSRVGKTTLITSILDDSQAFLGGTPVSLSPKDGATRKRINENRNYLSGAIRAKYFNPGALAGTEEAFTYDLEMSVEKQNMISFSFMDYPGGWLANNYEKWCQFCDSWLEDSTVLLVPIDATVIMEANTAPRKASVPHILHIADVKEVVRKWAKARKGTNERSILMFVPLKCETYFSDNGGLKKQEDKQSELSHLSSTAKPPAPQSSPRPEPPTSRGNVQPTGAGPSSRKSSSCSRKERQKEVVERSKDRVVTLAKGLFFPQKLYDEGEELLKAGQIKEALDRFVEASQWHFSRAMIKLGYLYEGNERVSPDKYESAKWYCLAHREDEERNVKWLEMKGQYSEDELDRINELCKNFVKTFYR